MPTQRKKKTQPQARGRGSMQPKGPGRWLVRVYLGEDPATGKRRYSSEVVQGTKRDAQQVLTRMLSEVDAGTFVPPSRLTMQEYLESWLGVKTDLSARTRMDYRTYFTRYVYPVLGSKRLDQVTHFDVQGLYNGMQARGLSGQTVRLVHAPLRQALSYAVQTDILAKNPSEYTKRPKLERKEQQVLTPEETNRFLVVAKDQGADWYALWCVLLMCGVRPSEALALKWDDVEGDTLRVRRALTQVGKGKYVEGPPKTRKGNRPIALPHPATVALQEHRTQQARAILKKGPRYKREGFVFASSAGTPLDLTRVRYKWKRALQAAGLPPLRLYDARHTHATTLIMAGVNPKVVQERLGHANISITLDTYTHVLPGRDREAADRLDEVLQQARAVR